MVFAVAVILSILAVLLAAAAVLRVQEAGQEKTMAQEYIASLEELCTDLQERTELSRRYYHDLRKHMRVLEAMAGQPQAALTKAGKNMAPGAWTDEAVSAGDQCKNTYRGKYTQNEVLRAILVSKEELCRRKEIPFQADVEDRAYEWIRDADLAAMLQNLLDNAVEAQERMDTRENRGIWLSMRLEETVLRIELANRVAPGERIDFRTRKENQSEHGFGTRIIQSVVQKYNGQGKTAVDKENHLLNIRIELPVPGCDGT